MPNTHAFLFPGCHQCFISEITKQTKEAGSCLEFHQVRVLVAGETELLLQVALHEGIGANGLQETGIDGLLVGLALLGSLERLVVREPLLFWVKLGC